MSEQTQDKIDKSKLELEQDQANLKPSQENQPEQEDEYVAILDPLGALKISQPAKMSGILIKPINKTNPIQAKPQPSQHNPTTIQPIQAKQQTTNTQTKPTLPTQAKLEQTQEEQARPEQKEPFLKRLFKTFKLLLDEED